MKKKTASYWLFLLGLLVFYIVPFGYSLWLAYHKLIQCTQLA